MKIRQYLGLLFIIGVFFLPTERALAIEQEALTSSKSHGGKFTWWRLERAKRQAELGAYLLKNRDEFLSFKNAPLSTKQGPLNFVGIPMVMFRLLPVLFPDIWGPPESMMAEVGLGRDPYQPRSVMPLGTGYGLSAGFPIPRLGDRVRVNYATFSCGACHISKVEGPDGRLRRLIGGANQIGDFSGQLNRTVNDPRYTPENFRAALNRQRLGWVYGRPDMIAQERLERALFNAPGGAAFFLAEVKLASNQTQQRLHDTLLAYTYNVPNPPPLFGIPGSLDVFSLAAAGFADPDSLSPAQLEAALPKAPAPADIPAAWNQRARPRYQWDDSVGSLIYREVAASLAVAAQNPAAINRANVTLAANFAQDLPASPYPFDVDQRQAARGRILFQQNCQGCHAPGNRVLQPPSRTGTDPNRANVFTSFLLTNLIREMRAACTLPACFGPGGAPLPDSQILLATGRYASIPLAGVWATAPYLHNGSVPTLAHLLTGDRPVTFYRANTTYDRKRVGFTWDRPTSRRAVLYDTRQAGHSNAGHNGPRFNGPIDWKNEPAKLADLLAYLKTL
jgi:mono/diheme cytochrome c family protein